MPRLDEAVGGQGCRLATVDDCLDNVRRQEGEIDEMGDPALGDALAVGDCLHGRPGLDLLEPDPAQGDGFEQRAVHTRCRVAQDELGLDPAATEGKRANERQRISV